MRRCCRVIGPDVAVAGVVGGLRAAGGVTQPGQRLVRVRGSGEPQAQRFGRVGEPAVVRGREVQGTGSFGQQVEDLAVAAHHGRAGGGRSGEAGVDAGEEVQQFPCAGAGWADALLVVAECLQGQVEVALLFVFADFGEQPGLGAAWAVRVAFGGGDRYVLQVQFCGKEAAGPVGELDRQGAA